MSIIQTIAQAVNFTVEETHTIPQINALQKELIKAVRTQIVSELKIKKQNVKDVQKIMKDIMKVALDEAFPKVKKAAAKKQRSKASKARKVETIIAEVPEEIVIDDCVIEEVPEVIPVKFVAQIPAQTVILAIEVDHSIKEFQSPKNKCSGFRIPTKSIKSAYKVPAEVIIEEVPEQIVIEETLSTEVTSESEDQEITYMTNDDFFAKCAQDAINDKFTEEITPYIPEQSEVEEVEEIDPVKDAEYLAICATLRGEVPEQSEAEIQQAKRLALLAALSGITIAEQIAWDQRLKDQESSEENEEEFEDVAQDFQVKSRRSVKISAVGLSAKAKKSLKVQILKQQK